MTLRRETLTLASGSPRRRQLLEMLGIPVGTVMSRLSRGRKQLRMRLAHYVSANGIGTRLQEFVYERG